MRKVLSSLFVILMAQSGKGQTIKAGDNFLNINDPVNYQFDHLVNYKATTVSVSDFKSRFLILDFWSTSCASCVQSWPKLIDLQKKFDSSIQILLVNPWEDKETVLKAFSKQERIKGIKMTLPSVYKDTGIIKLFKVVGIPQANWINKDGLFLAVTTGGQLNQATIRSVIRKNKFVKQQKRFSDELININPDIPIFMNGNGGNVDTVFSYSILSKGKPDLLSEVSFMPLPKGYRSYISCVNVDIKHMYSMAYTNRTSGDGVITLLKDNRIILNVKNPTKLEYMIDNEIQYDNLYVYSFEYLSKGSSKEYLQERMRMDLNNFFDYKAEWKKKKMKCLVFSAEDTSLIRYKTGDERYSPGDGIKFNKITMSQLIKRLEDDTEYNRSPYPFVDETSFTGLLGDIHLQVDGYGSDFIALDKELRKYKMRLTLQDREVEVLVISDAP